MSKRTLRWVEGKPSKQSGTVYYMRAWHNNAEFHIAKMIVGGVERFQLWKDNVLHGTFAVRLEALNHAETLT